MGMTPVGKTRLVYAPPSHRGATGHLLGRALEGSQWPDYSTILYLAPTPSKVREAQRIFHRLVRHPYIPPRFVTTMQLAMDLYNRQLPGKRLPRVLTPLVIAGITGQGIGYAKVIADLLRELKQHAPGAGLSRIHEDLAAIFSNLGMPEDARRTMDSALSAFASYETMLAGSGYLDDDDILARASAAAASAGPLCSVLIADGFTRMTTAERALMAVLAIRSRWSAIVCPLPETGPPPAYAADLAGRCGAEEELLPPSPGRELSFVGYAGVEEEFEGIARHIRSRYAARGHVIGDRISVVAPSLQEHGPLALRVFRRYGIPFAAVGGTNALGLPGMSDVFNLLDAAAEDFPRLPFTSFLNSPLFSGLDDAVRSHIPSLSLKSGIIKGRSSWQGLTRNCGDRETAARISAGLGALFGSLEDLASLREGCDGRDFLRGVQDLLQTLGFNAGRETRDELLGAMDLAGRLQDLQGGSPLPLKRHVDNLRHIVRSSGGRTEDAPVQLMDFGEACGLEPDILYFCGLKDGALPSRPPVDLVLPDSVRTAYGLPTFKGHLALQKLDFMRLCGAAADLHLSYPSMEGDKVNLPSSFLSLGGERAEQVFGIFSGAELQRRRGRGSFADAIGEIRIDGRTLDRIGRKELAMPLRVTDIDAFRRCPRRFFMERVLGLEASEVAEYEVEARLLGTLVHQTMERLLQSPLEDPEAARDSACRIMSEVLEDAPVEPYWKRLLTAAFLEMLPAILQQETALRSEGFLPDLLEMNLKEEVRPGIVLKGKVDRVDRSGALFRLLDYKTGSAEVGSAIIRKGKNLQLPLYAAMLAARGMEVEKAGIYSLREIGVQWIPTKRDKYSLADYVQASLDFLDGVVSDMRAGRFTAAPAEEFICAACPEAPFCPYVHSRRGASDA